MVAGFWHSDRPRQAPSPLHRRPLRPPTAARWRLPHHTHSLHLFHYSHPPNHPSTSHKSTHHPTTTATTASLPPPLSPRPDPPVHAVVACLCLFKGQYCQLFKRCVRGEVVVESLGDSRSGGRGHLPISVGGQGAQASNMHYEGTQLSGHSVMVLEGTSEQRLH